MRLCLASLGSLTLIGAILGSTPALAQQQAGRAFKLGEADVIPAVEIEFVSDSNAFLEADDPDEATGVIVSPEVEWRADRRLLTLRAGYSGEYGSFSEDSLGYDDHLLVFSVRSDFTARRRLGVEISFANDHEDLGTEKTRGRGQAFGSPVESNIFTVEANYTYGANTARGNVTAGLLVETVSFSDPEDGDGIVNDQGNLIVDDQNNVIENGDGDGLTDGDSFSLIRPYGLFTLRLSPDTRLLTELRFAQFDFDNDRRDRSEVTLLAGVQFSGSSKTGGSAKVGGTLATFAEEGIEDQTELVADVNLFFLPRTYSLLSLTFSRELDNLTDPDNVDGVNEIQATRDRGRFSWRHDWTERFNTIARADVSNIDRDCRNDVLISSAGLELNILPRRWIEFGISGRVEERAGSTNNCVNELEEPDRLDYEQEVVGVHVRVTL